MIKASQKHLRKKFTEGTKKYKETYLRRLTLAAELCDNSLCKRKDTIGTLYVSDMPDWWGSGINLSINEVDLPTVIEQVAGPFHRLYNVDWKLSVPYEGCLVLETEVEKHCVSIAIREGEHATCIYKKVITRQRTPEEIERAVSEAASAFEYSYKIDCSEE